MQTKILKIVRVIILSVLLCETIMPAQAADISALDFNGDLLGKVIPDGSVINYDNELIGHITADGFVLNNDNDLIGGIVPQGVAISVKNNILGKVNNDGSVTSVNDSLVGKVLPNGLVVNNNYDVIGAIVSPGVVYNDNGIIIGRVSGDGKFYNLAGENNGFVTPTGYVYTNDNVDRKYYLAGKLITSKIVVSSNGRFLGSIAPDGKVVDIKKNVIGTIHANGFVYNADNVAIGHIVENGYAFNTDGSYLGVVSFNGEVVNRGAVVAQAVFGNRVVNKDGGIIGFTINMAATANALNGTYLGRIVSNGTVVKGRNIIGKIGASGDVIDNKGSVIGYINQVGPIFGSLGQLKANATVDGSVVSLDGTIQGYMLKSNAFDYKEKEIGKLLQNRLIFDNGNTFMGINGIDTPISYKSKIYKISPYGYVFDESGNVDGKNYLFSAIYSPEGLALTNISGSGRTENITLNDKGKLTSSGYFVDKNNKLLGKVISEKYATNFSGEGLGYINGTNVVVDDKNNLYAKILPTGKVVSLDSKISETYGQASDASISISINGDYLGTNTNNGEVRNAGEIIGNISANQYVVDNQGALYGKALRYGVVVSPECKYLGVVTDSGEARSFNGNYLGMVLANNQVVSDSEEFIGQVIVPQPVLGKDGEIIGTETPLGTVLNYKNQNLGCRDIYGKIRNNQKEIIGQIVPSVSIMGFSNEILGYTDFEGKIINQLGEKVGVVNIDGGASDNSEKDVGVLFKYTVAFDGNNVYLGRVKPSGEVISDKGEVIGQVNYNGAVATKNGKDGYALYDLYVYDNEGKVVGYIAKNGRVYSVMGDLKGVIYHGFVIDKKQNLIARGARDYDIRNNNKKIIGYLTLEGKVINNRNIEVGTLTEDGEIINDKNKVIAEADPLQYYHKSFRPESADGKEDNSTDDIENVEDIDDIDDILEKSANRLKKGTKKDSVDDDFLIKEDENIDDKDEFSSDENSYDENMRNIRGLAITPGGKYIGEVNENQEVVDANGNKVGTVSDDGEILDKDGQKVGYFQEQQEEKSKGTNSKWWQNIIKDVTISPWDDTDNISNVGPGGGIGPGGRYNPRRAAILNRLYKERRNNISGRVISNNADIASYTGWQDNWREIGVPQSISTLRVDMSNMITEDKPIPAVLARSLISLGGVPVTAIVERNIYGDAGRNVIIPAGSKIIGGLQTVNNANRFDAQSGGMKLEISWNRIIRPDGIAFSISSAITGDAEGRGGGALGYVDEQLIKKYAMPIVGTLATSATAYLMAANQDVQEGQTIENAKQQAAADARQNFLDRMDKILDEIISSKEQIQPVTYVPAGTRIIIYPMQDLWLRTTKDIKEGRGSDIRGDNDEPPLISEEDDKPKNVQGNNKQQNNNNNQEVPLVANTNTQQNQQNTNAAGALPPPTADGTGMKMPDEEKKEDEIDIDF